MEITADREAMPAPTKTTNLYLQYLGVWIILQIAMVVIHSSPVLTGELMGPDSYMRMVRVQELLTHWDWHNSGIPRSNAPYGDNLHWTRPFDILLLIIGAPIALFAGWHEALFWAGAIVSPLLLLLCGFALIWAITPVSRPNSWLLPAIAILIQPGILAYAVLGRADHHIFLLLLFILSIGCMLRGLKNRYDLRILFVGGMLSGFAIWLSVENFLSVVAISGALGLAWLLSPENRARQGALYALGMLMMLALAMVSTHPESQWLKPVYDKVGPAHVLFAGLLLAFWCGILVLQGLIGRPKNHLEAIALAVLFAVFAAAVYYRYYRGFFGGPMVKVNPEIVTIWLDRVVEMKPIVPRSLVSLGEFIFYLGQGLIALPYLLWKLWKEREDPAWMAWFGLCVAIVIYWPVATLHVRFSSFTEVLFIIVLADLVDRMLIAIESNQNLVFRVLGKSAAICLLLVATTGLGSLLMNSGKTANAGGGSASPDVKTIADVCSIPAISQFLETSDRWPADKKLTILALLDIGPELLYRTRHQVLATPYHRNDQGILDSYKIMTADNMDDAKALADTRDIDLVLICPDSPERVFFTAPERKDTLYRALADGNPPSWLTAVDLPRPLSDEFKLYEKSF